MNCLEVPINNEASDSAEDLAEERSTRHQSVLIKYGGNAMVDPELIEQLLAVIAQLHNSGIRTVLVHGGGPYIQRLLDEVGLESRFIGGHRQTDARTIRYISMVLCGQVNGELVARLNRHGVQAVGISGRDAGLARAIPRKQHAEPAGGNQAEDDLGFVGDVANVDTSLINDLLDAGYLPVIAPVSAGPGGEDYNVNADMFAGHVAAALNVDAYLVLTDIDGLCRDKDDPATLISELSPEQVAPLLGSTIAGGMIPKVESCLIAVQGGVQTAYIINGTRPGQLSRAINGEACGTAIRS